MFEGLNFLFMLFAFSDVFPRTQDAHNVAFIVPHQGVVPGHETLLTLGGLYRILIEFHGFNLSGHQLIKHIFDRRP